jgi:hypothetical protein
MTTDASLRPKWIVRRDEQKARRALQAQQVILQERLAAIVVEKYSAQFCLDFLRWLQFNFDSLGSVSGSVKPVSNPNKGLQVYTVMLRRKPPLYRVFSGTIQFNQPNANGIWIHSVEPDDLKDWDIRLAFSPNGESIGGIWKDDLLPLDAMRIAELVAEEMTDYVDPLP